MPKCKWRDRPSAPESCKTLASSGKELCPRHEFLQSLKDQKAAEKLSNGTGAGTPKTRAAMITAGYTFTGPGVCKGCDRRIEWWQTPSGKAAPYNTMTSDAAPSVSHFITCTKASDFKRAS